MLKQLLNTNNSSLLYACEVSQFKRILNEENLSVNELNVLKGVLEIHNKKTDVFSYIVEQTIENKIQDTNENK